jgi:hypothetical protein
VSSYPQTSARPASASSARPTTLLVALGAAVVAALAAIINAVMVMIAGSDLAVDLVAKAAGVSRDEYERVAGPEGVEALKKAAESANEFDVIGNRAILTLACGVLLLVFGLLMHRAALWARILVTISALGAAGISLVTATKTDEGTSMMITLAWIVVIVSVIALITAWLPGNARYAKTAKAAR